MAGIANNRRTLYTKKVIREEFIQLLQQKSLSQITVKEICEAADVNRGTFYKYYADAHDLFQTIENTLIEEILASIQLQEQPFNQWLPNFLEVMRENKDATIIILNNKTESRLLTSILNKVKMEALASFAILFEEATSEELELYFIYFVEGTVGLITKWLKDFPYIKPETISTMIQNIQQTKFETPD